VDEAEIIYRMGNSNDIDENFGIQQLIKSLKFVATN